MELPVSHPNYFTSCYETLGGVGFLKGKTGTMRNDINLLTLTFHTLNSSLMFPQSNKIPVLGESLKII